MKLINKEVLKNATKEELARRLELIADDAAKIANWAKERGIDLTLEDQEGTSAASYICNIETACSLASEDEYNEVLGWCTKEEIGLHRQEAVNEAVRVRILGNDRQFTACLSKIVDLLSKIEPNAYDSGNWILGWHKHLEGVKYSIYHGNGEPIDKSHNLRQPVKLRILDPTKHEVPIVEWPLCDLIGRINDGLEVKAISEVTDPFGWVADFKLSNASEFYSLQDTHGNDLNQTLPYDPKTLICSRAPQTKAATSTLPIDNPKVQEVIAMLREIDVDGETMEYILRQVGMEDQMLKQLSGGD